MLIYLLCYISLFSACSTFVFFLFVCRLMQNESNFKTIFGACLNLNGVGTMPDNEALQI